jgi:hypothetical protein
MKGEERTGSNNKEGSNYVGFEVIAAVTMKFSIF